MDNGGNEAGSALSCSGRKGLSRPGLVFPPSFFQISIFRQGISRERTRMQRLRQARLTDNAIFQFPLKFIPAPRAVHWQNSPRKYIVRACAGEGNGSFDILATFFKFVWNFGNATMTIWVPLDFPWFSQKWRQFEKELFALRLKLRWICILNSTSIFGLFYNHLNDGEYFRKSFHWNHFIFVHFSSFLFVVYHITWFYYFFNNFFRSFIFLFRGCHVLWLFRIV